LLANACKKVGHNTVNHPSQQAPKYVVDNCVDGSFSGIFAASARNSSRQKIHKNSYFLFKINGLKNSLRLCRIPPQFSKGYYALLSCE
jgi:hypothetical protein